MRRVWASSVLFLASSAQGLPQAAKGAQDVWWASKRYYVEVGTQCPQKHLDWLPYGELPDVIDDFSKRLSHTDRERIRRAEADRCGADSIGASCGNKGFLRVMVNQNKLDQFAKFVCSLPKHCAAQSECK